MVASFLITKRKASWISLLFLLLFCNDIHEGRSQALDPQSGSSLREESFIEEDLPPQESPPDIPAVSDEPNFLEPQVDPREVQPPPADASSHATSPPAVHIPLSPQDVVALRFVEEGKGLLAQERFDQAREQFEKAISIAPLQPYSYYFLGRVTFARGEHKQALAFLQKAELLFSANDQSWRGETACLKGAIYEDLGENSQARSAYQQCLELVPQNLSALSALARLPAEEPFPSNDYSQEPSFYPGD